MFSHKMEEARCATESPDKPLIQSNVELYF